MTKMCWYCKHFLISQAFPHYSTLTPGSGFGMECLESVWEFDPYEITDDKLGEILSTAQTCSKFELKNGISEVAR